MSFKLFIMNKKVYMIPCLKALNINEEGELLNATLNGEVILEDDPTTGSDDPWNDGLGKKNVWDEE